MIWRSSAAKKALSEALDSKDPKQLKAALCIAQEANLGTCAESELARSLTAPSVLLREALQGSDIVASPTELRGLIPADAVAAELAATEDMTEEQLKARVVELSRWLAAGRLHAKARLEGALAAQLEHADEQGLRSLEEGLEQLKEEHYESAESKFEAMGAALHGVQVETVDAAVSKISQESEEGLVSTRSQLLEASDEIITAERAICTDDVVIFAKGLRTVEEQVECEAHRIEHVHACNRLSSAVLALEDAILTGSSCESELRRLESVAAEADVFVAGLLAKLPEGYATICREGAVPSEEAIKKRLPSHLQRIATAAFLPPGGGTAAEIIAQLFGVFYVASCDACPGANDEDDAAKETSANLAAISRVLRAKRAGELEVALLNLQTSLTGPCRDAAADWLTKTCSALLLRQALWAIKARVQCVTSASA